MSNKSFFVLIGAIFSPFVIIWLAENVNGWSATLLFTLVVLAVPAHFRRSKDL